MREIKFRGLTSNNTWVYGLPVQDVPNETSYYKEGFTHRMTWIEGDSYYNQPFQFQTIGQFTGLYDKNGKEIYEGDLVRNTHKFWRDDVIEVKFGEYDNGEFYEDRRSGYGWYTIKGDEIDSVAGLYTNEYIEVIGNIHVKGVL